MPPPPLPDPNPWWVIPKPEVPDESHGEHVPVWPWRAGLFIVGASLLGLLLLCGFCWAIWYLSTADARREWTKDELNRRFVGGSLAPIHATFGQPDIIEEGQTIPGFRGHIYRNRIKKPGGGTYAQVGFCAIWGEVTRVLVKVDLDQP